MAALCGVSPAESGEVWALYEDNKTCVACAVVAEDGRLSRYMTRPQYQRQGYAGTMLDMLTELFEELYVDYPVTGAAVTVLLGAGFLPVGDTYVYSKG